MFEGQIETFEKKMRQIELKRKLKGAVTVNSMFRMTKGPVVKPAKVKAFSISELRDQALSSGQQAGATDKPASVLDW